MSGDIVYSEDNDCYAILGVDSNCDDASLRRSYKRLLLKLHPDKQPVHAREEAHVPFTRMQNAYESVGEPRKRRKYNTKRTAHFRAMYKAAGIGPTFCYWMDLEEERIKMKEQTRQGEYDDLRRQKEQESTHARNKQEESKKRQREEQQRRWEERREEKQRRQEEQEGRGGPFQEQRRREEQEGRDGPSSQEQSRREEQDGLDGPFQEEIASMEADRRQVAHHFNVWKARQKQEREKEVSDREAQRLELHQKQEKDYQEMVEAHKRQLEELHKSHQKHRENLTQRHERQKRVQRDLQHKQGEFQRNERKRTRDEYNSWLEKANEDIQNLQNGMDTRAFKQAKRPDFNTPQYGWTKDGLPCQVCQQRGRFCAMHKAQQGHQQGHKGGYGDEAL